MTYFPLTKAQREWQERVAAIAQHELAPRAAETDRTGRYPQESLEAAEIICRIPTPYQVEHVVKPMPMAMCLLLSPVASRGEPVTTGVRARTCRT